MSKRKRQWQHELHPLPLLHAGVNSFHLCHNQGVFTRAGNNLNSTRPATAEKTDARKIPSLALSIRFSLKAIFAINSAMVKPIPARKLPPVNNLQLSSGGRIAMCKRTASQLNNRIPIGLPNTKPEKIATVSELPRSFKVSGNPALANAKRGIMTKPTQGCSKISRRSTGDSVSRAAISAICNVCRSSVSLLLSLLAGCAIT